MNFFTLMRIGHMRIILLLLPILLLLGCAEDSHFIAYQGAQQNWPTAPGSMVETKFAVPVYYGLPPRKYRVMGELTAEEEGRWRWSDPESDAMEDVAKEAKKIGADAIIVTGRETGVGGYISSGTATVSGNTAYGRGITRSIKTAQARVVAIKFR
jgi:hypothetical protein